MKNLYRKNCSSILATIAIMLISTTFSTAQGVIANKEDRPFFYISAAYVNSIEKNHVTPDEFYSQGGIIMDKTVRADFGVHLNNKISLEVGYMRMPLSLYKHLAIGGQPISNGGISNSRISFYSIRLNHKIPISKNRVFLKSGLGYALGKSNRSFEQLGPSAPKTSTHFENIITTTRIIKNLHSGSNSNHLILSLGLEFNIFKKLNLFANYTMSKGFTDLQNETIDYFINDSSGSFTTTSDGSYSGYELGVKFMFR